MSPISDANDEDERFVLGQDLVFTQWLIEMQENCPIRWINSPTAARAAENKFTQLKIARSHGIVVPRTLVTAQPDRFRDFLKVEGTIVVKPLRPYMWEYKSGKTLTLFASVLDAERGSKLSDEDIKRCITVYQQRIDKIAEVRVVVLGQEAFAYKIIQEGEQHLDFRIGFYLENHLRYEPILLPASLKAKIIRFMDSMNINFASADFAQTADQEFVFLDLNPSGQWLFIEEVCPEARLGQKFCSFFATGNVDSSTENLFPSYTEYKESDEAKSMEEAFRQQANRPYPAYLWKESQQ